MGAWRQDRRPHPGSLQPLYDLKPTEEELAFLAASRRGDFEAPLAVLDPDVVVRADRVAAPPGAAREMRGAPAAAEQALTFSRRALFAQPALVNGAVGAIAAPRGRLIMVLAFKFKNRKIVEIDIFADPARLRQIDLAVLDR